MRKNILYSINIIIPLLTGAAAYVIFRQDTYIYELASSFLQINFSVGSSKFVMFCRGYLSDILWAYSLMFSVQAVYRASGKKLIFPWCISSAFLTLSETLQLTSLMPGTFDLFDIVAEIASATAALLIIIIISRRSMYEKSD